MELGMMADFVMNLVQSLDSGTGDGYTVIRKETDIFKNAMSGYYQKYLDISRDLDLYLIDLYGKIVPDGGSKEGSMPSYHFDKMFNRNVTDLKIEAIDEVVFAQKITENYYKEYRRENINFFGVLKNISKFKKERATTTGLRKEFFERQKNLTLMKVFQDWDYGKLKNILEGLKDNRVQLLEELYSACKVPLQLFDDYKAQLSLATNQ
jgi:hypothetical protein